MKVKAFISGPPVKQTPNRVKKYKHFGHVPQKLGEQGARLNAKSDPQTQAQTAQTAFSGSLVCAAGEGGCGGVIAKEHEYRKLFDDRDIKEYNLDEGLSNRGAQAYSRTVFVSIYF